MKIGNRLKELRIQKGLTQEELADRCELSKGFISQLERDLTSPSIATLVDILQCLGTDIREFFSESPKEEQIVEASTIRTILKKWTKSWATQWNGLFQMPRKILWNRYGLL